MRLTKLALFLLCGALARGAGTISQTMERLGESDHYVVNITFTGDASDGTLPATAMLRSSASLSNTDGYSIVSVTTNPGSPAPTDNWDLTFIDADGLDVLENACVNRSTSTTQSCSATVPHPLKGEVVITITGNAVNSAVGVIRVFLTRTTMARRQSGTSAGAAGGDLSGTYPNPSVATVGGETAANIAAGVALANAAVTAATPNTLMLRGASGEVAATTITANTINGTATAADALSANPAPCGANQYVTDIAANGTLTCSVPTVVENPICTFTAESSKACAHNLASDNLIYACWDNASPKAWLEPLSVVKTNTNTATVTWAAAFTGTCFFNVGGGSGGGGGGRITSFESQTGAIQTVTDDTNVTWSSSANVHTLGWTGSLAIARGGTAATTAAGARVNLLPSYAGNTLKVLRVNAGETDLEWATVGGGGGSYTEGSGIDIIGTVISVDPTVTATFLRGNFAHDFSSINTGACAQTTVTLTGAATGQEGGVAVSGAAFPVGVNLQRAKVTATNTVAIEICNLSGSSYDPSADRTFTITLFQ